MIAPALFLGHGSPENVIRDNAFTRSLARLGARLPRPRAALIISAHWLSRGTGMTIDDRPEQVFDFGGFARELYEVYYQPHNSSELVERVQAYLPETQRVSGQGYDHGVWTVLKHLWPDADVPLVQLSLNLGLDRAGHWLLAERLRGLREEGFMVIASGNIVHNLRMLDWRHPEQAYDWAVAFDNQVKQALETRDRLFLTQSPGVAAREARLSVPSEDHYWPLLYVAALRLHADRLEWVYNGFEYGSISLTSFLLAPG